MSLHSYIGLEVTFETPYFETLFQFNGKVIGFRNQYLLVEYENVIDDRRYTLQTEITENQIVN